MGLPWLIRKLLGKAERTIRVEFHGISKDNIINGKVQSWSWLKGKLLGSSRLVYFLDGKVHDLALVSPLPMEKKATDDL